MMFRRIKIRILPSFSDIRNLTPETFLLLKPETLYFLTHLLKSAHRSNAYIPIDRPDKFG